MTNITQVLYKS